MTDLLLLSLALLATFEISMRLKPLKLNNKQYKKFEKAVDNPPKPNKLLKEILMRARRK